MRCRKDGSMCCVEGKKYMAFALMEREEEPDMNEAYDYVKGHLYYCSGQAEKHFLDTGSHEIDIAGIDRQ